MTGSNVSGNSTTLVSDLSDIIADATKQVRVITGAGNSDPASILYKVTVVGMDSLDEGVILYLAMTTMDGETSSISIPFPEFGLG
jgi:hypothetical protein